jgi:hypothetical protein
MEEIIRCSDCDKPLMHVKRYGSSDKVTKLKCSCPFCKGTSFVHTITGQFACGPIGQDEFYSATVIADTQQKDNQWLFIIHKR